MRDKNQGASGNYLNGGLSKAARALALLLVAAPAFAQSPAERQKPVGVHANQTAAGIKEASARPRAGTYLGKSSPLGGGSVRSWVTLDKDGNPTAIGLTFTEAALSGLPQNLPAGQEGVEYVLALPPEAASTAFDHVGINWNPHGHSPAGIYDTGHFDFHFYTITPEERSRITARGEDLARARKQPAIEYVPAGYIYAPDSEIPRMGGHWVDPQSNEFQKQPFTRTFLYGNYDGRIVFMEPMITKAFLESKVSVTETIKLPSKYARPGYYPTRYSIKYDAGSAEYSIALEGLTLR